VSLPLQDLLWELRQRRVQLRVQVKEEIEEEAAVNKRDRVS
jgi:hypothetical protein